MDIEAHRHAIPATDADSAPPRHVGPFVPSPSVLVRDVVFHMPGASRAMERFRLDYCCGGAKTLSAICEEARVSVDALLVALEEEKAKGGETDQELLETPLEALVGRIVKDHHELSRQEGQRLVGLAAAARDAHAERYPKLGAIAKETKLLFDELLPHLVEEEKILFPYVEQLERAGTEGKPAPVALFATIRHVLVDMEREHEECESVMARLRSLAADYAVDETTPAEVRALYEGLDAHEKDLVRHMHLEGNVVFPRAERLETKLRGGRRR